MVDLNRALRPLIDQPPAEPEPLEELEARAWQRCRRRRVSFAAALASAVAIVVTVGVMWTGHDGPNRIETVAPGDMESPTQRPLLPTKPVVVAAGEIDGHPWRLQANETESGLCVNLLEGGRACFDASTRRAVAVAADFTVTEDATGTGRVSVAAVYGPVRRDVARIAIRLASGEVVETSPVGQDAGFATNQLLRSSRTHGQSRKQRTQRNHRVRRHRQRARPPRTRMCTRPGRQASSSARCANPSCRPVPVTITWRPGPRTDLPRCATADRRAAAQIERTDRCSWIRRSGMLWCSLRDVVLGHAGVVARRARTIRAFCAG
jgi:hypothetical protein